MAEKKVNFKAEIELRGKTATGIVVPEKFVKELGSSRKPQVKATIKGYMYRTSVAFMGGEFMLPVSAEVRAAAGVEAGEVVEVELTLDNEPREVELPADFLEALNGNVAAKKFFEGLSYSNKRRLVTPIADAKAAETRQRRIEKTITSLSEGKV